MKNIKKIQEIREIIEDEIPTGMSIDGGNYYINISSDEDEEIAIQFSSESIRYCCGVIELGELEASKNFPQNIFDMIMFRFIESKKLIIVNVVDEWLKNIQNCKYFDEVRTFVNPESNNTIHVFMSKDLKSIKNN